MLTQSINGYTAYIPDDTLHILIDNLVAPESIQGGELEVQWKVQMHKHVDELSVPDVINMIPKKKLGGFKRNRKPVIHMYKETAYPEDPNVPVVWRVLALRAIPINDDRTCTVELVWMQVSKNDL